MMLFETHRVNKAYAAIQALSDVTISVEEGTIFGLLGPNGAGKTTLLRIINQITAPDSGALFFGGRALRSADIEQIGYLPEERGLYKKMKVGEQALYLARLKGMERKEALTSLKKWFEKFEIEAWWGKKIEELSKGMQQKVQFITTVIHNPKLLIFDEPFSGFDPINTNLIKQEILQLRENGATIIFSTHNMASVEELCDHIALINKSEKILDGQVDEVKQQYKSHIFEVSYTGQQAEIEAALTPGFKILEHTSDNRVNRVKVQYQNGSEDNELLTALLPKAKICGFNEVIPSMNDVFIKVVEKARKN